MVLMAIHSSGDEPSMVTYMSCSPLIPLNGRSCSHTKLQRGSKTLCCAYCQTPLNTNTRPEQASVHSIHDKGRKHIVKMCARKTVRLHSLSIASHEFGLLALLLLGLEHFLRGRMQNDRRSESAAEDAMDSCSPAPFC